MSRMFQYAVNQANICETMGVKVLIIIIEASLVTTMQATGFEIIYLDVAL